ncbi:hypothetical protein SUNI508_05600 [Seiridium unicorne]|uniref:2EXR domain-containing protein n=1 Tax=Seiridium unicorne TaxID=138068 RepID=A0ABR2V431_9PEZI
MTPDETGTGQYSGSMRDDKRQIKALSRIQQSIEALSQKVEAIARDQTLQRAVNADILERLATMEHNAGQRYSDLDEKADSCLEDLSELHGQFVIFQKHMPSVVFAATSPPEFPLFRRLPLEIRNMIWKRAIPARLLEINEIWEDMAPGIAEYAFMVPLPPPAIAGVCRDARAVACQTGRLVCIDNRRMVWDPAHAPGYQYSWFDPAVDSLSIATEAPLVFGRTIRHILQMVSLFPNLQIVNMAEETYYIGWGQNLRLEIAVFGVGNQTDPIFIDVDDATALGNLEQKFVTFEGPEHRFTTCPGHISCVYKGEKTTFWPLRLRMIQDKWLRERIAWTPLAGPQQTVNLNLWGSETSELLAGANFRWIQAVAPQRSALRAYTLLQKMPGSGQS